MKRALLAMVVSLAAAQTAGRSVWKAGTPESAPAQPLPFSHRVHAELKLRCAECHRGAARDERAGLPETKLCMACHVAVAKESPHVRELAKAHAEGRAVQWVRVYRTPDFVFFSHKSHTDAGVGCAQCHGAVEKRDVLYREVGTDMDTCMKCHTERGASKDCALCHQLGH